MRKNLLFFAILQLSSQVGYMEASVHKFSTQPRSRLYKDHFNLVNKGVQLRENNCSSGQSCAGSCPQQLTSFRKQSCLFVLTTIRLYQVVLNFSISLFIIVQNAFNILFLKSLVCPHLRTIMALKLHFQSLCVAFGPQEAIFISQPAGDRNPFFVFEPKQLYEVHRLAFIWLLLFQFLLQRRTFPNEDNHLRCKLLIVNCGKKLFVIFTYKNKRHGATVRFIYSDGILM